MGLNSVDSSAKLLSVRRAMRQSRRMVCRIAFAAFALTAGVKLVKSRPALVRARRGQKGISEKIKTDLRIPAPPIGVPAIDNLRLRPVDLKSAAPEALDHRLPDLLRLGLSPAVDHDIIRVPFERHAWMAVGHPVLDQDDLRRRIVPVGARPRNVLSRATIAALPCIAASQSGVAPSSFTASASAPDTRQDVGGLDVVPVRRPMQGRGSVALSLVDVDGVGDQPACSVAVARFWN